MKNFRKKYQWFFLFPIFLIFFFNTSYEIIKLNRLSIDLSTSLMNDRSFHIKTLDPINNNMNCHYNWMVFIEKEYKKQNIEIFEKESILNCSFIYVNMIRTFFPNDKNLAIKAVEIYPDMLPPLYWLAESQNTVGISSTKEIYSNILSLAPDEGLAWCRLGAISEYEGEIAKAITSFSNCCRHNDPGLNGCYNAGRLLEKEGEYIEAIKYYRLSWWDVSKVAADKLEAELLGQE